MATTDSRDADPRGLTSTHSDTAELRDAARRERVDTLNAEAESIRRIDHDRLRALCEQSFELACQCDIHGNQYEHGMAVALTLLAHRNSVIGESGAALSRAYQALALLDAETPSSLLADLYISIGWAHYASGDYVDALRDLMVANRMAETVGDRYLQALAMDRIANVYESTGHAPTAMEMQTIALGIFRDLGDSMGEALLLNNMAYTYLTLERYEAALESARATLAYAEVNGPIFLHMGVLDTLADVYLATGELDEAAEHSTRGLKIARTNVSEVDEADALLTLGRIRLQQGRIDDARETTMAALTINEKHRRSVEEYLCHELLADIEEQRGDIAAALVHLRRFHDLEREKVNEQTASRIASMRVEHQVESARKDAEIHRLRSIALEQEVEERRIAQATLQAQASLDPLTGLYNRGHVSVLAEDYGSALRRGLPVSIILADVDHFKEVNDTFGHLAGDRALIEIARLLRENARASDTPCRYGGDEFLVVLEGMPTDQVIASAERIRKAVSAHGVKHHSLTIPLTVSIGVATAEPGSGVSLAYLIERADRALYRSKHAGRNCVTAAGM